MIGTSKTINDALHQQSIISQGALDHELTAKDSRSFKQTTKSTASSHQRPMTSNYVSHSGIRSQKQTSMSGNYTTQPLGGPESYHLGSGP